jgi:hypothetical protein
VAFGWLLILPGASDGVPSLCLVNLLMALSCMIFKWLVLAFIILMINNIN